MTPENVLRQILAVLTEYNWHQTVAPWLESSLSDGTRIPEEYVGLQPQAKILVSSRSLPYLAILWRGADRRWRLRSFEFQCPACFGTGVLGHHPDWEICGASGGSERVA